MLRNYLISTWRRLRRHLGQTVINVFGLTAGIACCLLILLFVRHEVSVDGFHANADRIFRLNKVHAPEIGVREHSAVSSGMMGPTLVADYPAVEATVRMLPWFDDVVLTREPVSTKVPALLIADRNFFEVFDFELVRGNPRTALDAPMSIVLAADVAEVLFPGQDPIGHTLVGLDGETYTVTGIAARAPAASHIYFDALVSWSSTVPGQGPLEYQWLNNWLTQSLYTYVLLRPGSSEEALKRRLPEFMARHFPERAEQYQLYLQPLDDIYLESSAIQHARKVRSGNRTYVYVLSIIGVLVLFIAGVNFVNLSTARASQRMREVGIRKALGATRAKLAALFLAEAVLLSVFAALVALLAVEVALPQFAAYTGREIRLDALAWAPGIVAAAVLIGIVAGAYPAAVQTRYLPVHALRDGLRSGRRHGRGRHVLVVAQFVISISLLIGTAVVYGQMRFIQTKDLGFEAEQVIVLNTGGTKIEFEHEAFTGRLRLYPGVEHAAAGRNVPGHGTMEFSLYPEGRSDEDVLTSPVFRIAHAEMDEALGLEMAEGRFFSDDRSGDLERGVVINEELAQNLGWQNAVGKRLGISGELEEGVVIGVVENFHFESFHRPIDPLVIMVDSERAGYILVRIRPDNVAGTIDYLRKQWEAFEERYPFEYSFLDDAFGAFYETERKLMATLGLFSLLAVGIGCLGLWGLAAFLTEERTKEIGIRKVLGASVSRILMLLSMETVGLVLISFAIAAPASYLVITRWLQNFAYRIEISPALFLAAGGTALLLAAGTVGYQALRAASTDPVVVLRDQ